MSYTIKRWTIFHMGAIAVSYTHLEVGKDELSEETLIKFAMGV